MGRRPETPRLFDRRGHGPSPSGLTTNLTDFSFNMFVGGVRQFFYAPASAGLRHAVATFKGGVKTFYVDGMKSTTGNQPGDFSAWDATYPINVFGEQAAERPTFPGAIHLVAVYSRALTDAEVAVNFAAGADP